MSDQTPSMAELKTATGTDDSTDDDGDEVSEDEYIDAPSVNVRPECGLYFDAIVDFGFTGELDYAQNFRGDERRSLDEEPTGGYGGSIALTLENPSVGDGQLWKSTDEDQTADYRLVGPQTTSVETVDTGDEEVTVGVEYSGRSFKSEQVDDFDEEYVTVYLSSGMAEYVARRLDALGGLSTQETLDGPEDYDGPVGLLERPPEGSSAFNAIRRRPLLRADMTDTRGALLIELGETDNDEDSGAFLATMFTFDEDGNFDELEPITDTDHEGYRDTSEPYRGELAWPETHGSNDTSTDESVDEATTDLSFDGIDDGSSDELTYDDLPAEWQQFADTVHNAEGIDVEEYDVEAAAQNFVESNDPVEFGDLSASEIATVVRAEA